MEKVDIYKKHHFKCQCGHEHEMPIGKVIIEEKSAQRLPKEISELKLGKKGILITDEQIDAIEGENLYDIWRKEGLDIQKYVVNTQTKPDEEGIGKVICHIPFDVDFLVSLGGGTITDMTRYVATRLKKKCIAIPSAMTMDGFFTNMSVIIIDGMQITHYLDYPDLILVDPTIITKAPVLMNAAGVGEVLSKISAGIDWYAGKLIKQMYYCEEVARMMQSCIEEGSSIQTVQGIAKAEKQAVKNLADALYRSAVAMAWYGSSPCGSGAEHQLNHFWIKCQDQKGIRQSMHGQAVGVGAVINRMLWEKITAIDFQKFDIENAVEKIWQYENWQQEIRRVYQEGAEEVFNTQKDNHSFEKNDRKAEIISIIQNMESLRSYLRKVPSAQEIVKSLKIMGAPYKPEQLGLSEEDVIDSLYYAKESRSGRYNALWIIEALGITEAVSQEILQELEKI